MTSMLIKKTKISMNEQEENGLWKEEIKLLLKILWFDVDTD